MEFKEWFNQQFAEWRGTSRRGVSDFAEYLGLKQPQVSDWLNGRYKPRGENADLLAGKLGPEVYDALGIRRPTVIPPSELLEKLPLDRRQQFIDAVNEAVKQIQESGFLASSPEAIAIWKDVMVKHGL